MKTITREQFQEMLAEGRKFCWAALYERQDFKVQIAKNDVKVVREITQEPELWHRSIGK